MQMQERTIDDRLFPDAESRRDAWQRLAPFYHEIISGEDQLVLIVSHGDLLSLFHAMFLGMQPESLNEADMFGLAGGVSMLQVTDDGRHRIRKLSDMSYIL